MHEPQSLRFIRFGASRDPLVVIEREVDSRQAKYLRCYLHDLGARSIVLEENYFDRKSSRCHVVTAAPRAC